MNEQQDGPPPIALAMEWVAKITTVGLVMALPAIGGGYLDSRLGTTYWALVGVILGVVAGMWHLLQITKSRPGKRGNNDKSASGGQGGSGGQPDGG